MAAIYRSSAGAAAIRAGYEGFLRHWPVPNQQRHIGTRLGETFVVTCGAEDAPPLVLLHGAGFNSLTWMGDVASWSQHFRVIAVDVIGHPGLSAPVRPPYASDEYACWLDEVLDSLHVARAAFVGLSLGGWIALDYAIRRPQRVDGLVLLAPAGVGREKMSMLEVVCVILPLTMLGSWGRKRAQRLMLGEYREPTSPGEKAVAAFSALITRHFRQNLAKPVAFSDAQLASIAARSLVLVGANDPWMDAQEIKARFGRVNPCATVEILPNRGHMLVGLTGRILDFLRSAP